MGRKYVYSPEYKHEGKKFCSSYCREQHYQALKPKIKPKPKKEEPKETKESKPTKKEKASNPTNNASKYN